MHNETIQERGLTICSFHLAYGIQSSVIQMAKSTLLHGEIQQVQDAVYAISLDTCTESLETAAHPKDMQLFRDALASFQHATVLNHNCADIQSSIPLMRENVGHFQQERRNHMGQEATKQPGVTAATSATDKNNSSNNTANNNTRKTTTAQAFFRGPSATTTAPTTTAAVQPTHAITSTKSKKPFFGTSSTHSTTVSTTRTHKNETSVSVAPRDKEKLRTTSTTKSAVLPADKNSCIPEEKENARNATVIGTADDFMGDEDEDEEFLQQEKLRQDRRLLREGKAVSSSQQEQRGRPKVQQQQQQPRSKPISTTNVDTKSVHKDDNREEEEQQQQQHQPVVSGKKRRKKLVEKTTMDEHGYMHTETHVEWEEISVVDEPPAAVVEKKVIKNTKNMKQGSLMGFFSKK